MRALLALVLIATSILVLELARKDVVIIRFDARETPVTAYSIRGANGPVVVIAHASRVPMWQGLLPSKIEALGYKVRSASLDCKIKN